MTTRLMSNLDNEGKKIHTVNILIAVFDHEELSIFNNSLYNTTNQLIDKFNFFSHALLCGL